MARITSFLVLAFAISWSIAGMLRASGGFAGAGPIAAFYLVAYMFGPAISAIVITLIYDRKRFWSSLGLVGIRVPRVLLWVVIGWVAAILVCALATLIAGLAGGGGFADPAEKIRPVIENALAQQGNPELPFSVDTLILLQFAINVPVGILINTVILTISEELGWRGWLQPRLMALGFWPMCLVTGLIWGIWHAPIIIMGHNYPGLPILGPVLMTIFCILNTPIIALMRERGLTWAAGAYHGCLNAVAGFSILFLAAPGTWMWNGVLGLGGFAVLLVACAVVNLWRRANPLPAATAAPEAAQS